MNVVHWTCPFEDGQKRCKREKERDLSSHWRATKREHKFELIDRFGSFRPFLGRFSFLDQKKVIQHTTLMATLLNIGSFDTFPTMTIFLGSKHFTKLSLVNFQWIPVDSLGRTLFSTMQTSLFEYDLLARQAEQDCVGQKSLNRWAHSVIQYNNTESVLQRKILFDEHVVCTLASLPKPFLQQGPLCEAPLCIRKVRVSTASHQRAVRQRSFSKLEQC